MKHLIKKENNILHGTIGWSHKGNDGQYCEAGETVKIKWQPDSGWGLQEVHYTDGGGNVVAIEGGEFTMPDSDVVIDATFKKFVIGYWTSGKDAAENAGKVLGFDEGGNLVPADGGGGLSFKIIDIYIKDDEFEGGTATIDGTEYPVVYGDSGLYLDEDVLPIVQALASQGVIVTYSHQDSGQLFPPRYYCNAFVYEDTYHSQAGMSLYIFSIDQQLFAIAFGDRS